MSFLKRFVLLQDKNGNDVLAEDLRPIGGNGGGDGWSILIVASTILIENYILLKYLLNLNHIEQPAWYYMLLCSAILSYFLGVVYGFIPKLSYLAVGIAVLVSFMFSLNFFEDSFWIWIIRGTFALFIGFFTYIGNLIMGEMFAEPY
ncbi:hypothetical protein M3649_20785 [Ureibacillus chungkukjangi]|uniref:hypothetical protein n=1 Tax=Ureibacillus chungkukjangi TaxID=1202712 RepID=UPI00203FABB2|nr:hypothetical protein [Ureibacillus chungkukjangi]MCM3390524.1 hypothetical protein [Ureibacillus chungkukjangi]